MSEAKGIQVIGVEVSDFRPIKFARVDIVPGVGVVRVTGKNIDTGGERALMVLAILAFLGG